MEKVDRWASASEGERTRLADMRDVRSEREKDLSSEVSRISIWKGLGGGHLVGTGARKLVWKLYA